MLTPNRAWYSCFRAAWWLSRTQIWLTWTKSALTHETSFVHSQNVVSKEPVSSCWCRCRPQNYSCKEKSLQIEYWYGCSVWLLSTSWALGWSVPNSRAIPHALLRSSRSTAAIKIFILDSVCTVRRRSSFKNAVRVTLSLARKRCCSNRNTRVGTLIVATIYLQLIQNRYMFRSFTVLQCSYQHCVQPVASDVEVVGYL